MLGSGPPESQSLVSLGVVAIIFVAGALLIAQGFNYSVGVVLVVASVSAGLWVTLLKRALGWVLPMLLGVAIAILILLILRTVLPITPR